MEVNKTNHYLLRKWESNANGKVLFDIESKDLLYSDFSPTHHGLQCNHVGRTETHEEIMKLCKQMCDIVKKIDALNNAK